MSQPLSSSRTQHFVFLDGLRGIAALGVMFGHQQSNYPWIWWPAPFGVAVDFFFMLSGFVIAHAYEKRLRTDLSFVQFAKVRLIRLQPMLVVGMILGILLWTEVLYKKGVNWTLFWQAAGLSLFCIPGPAFTAGSSYILSINPPAWSLFFEYVANFLYAACARHITRLRLVVLVLTSAAALIAATLLFRTAEPGARWLDIAGGLPRVLFGFGVGLLLYQVRLNRTLGLAGATVLAGVLGALMVWPYYVPTAVKLGLILLLLPLLLHVAAATKVQGRAAQLCAWLGAISYPLYIVHHPIMRGLSEIIAPFDPSHRYTWPIWISTAILTILIAHLLATWVDAPLRRYLWRLASRPDKAQLKVTP